MKEKLLLRFCVPLLLLTFFLSASAQERIITGVITTRSGQPLAGATVLAKGTDDATSTDAQGRFRMDVPGSVQTLVISYVGYLSKEIPVPASGSVSLELEETGADLNE